MVYIPDEFEPLSEDEFAEWWESLDVHERAEWLDYSSRNLLRK